MPLPLIPFIPPVLSMLGGLFGAKSKQKKEKAAYEAQRPALERAAGAQASRGGLFGGMSRAYGIGDTVGGDARLNQLATPTPVAPYSGSGNTAEILAGLFGNAAQNFPKPTGGEPFDDATLEEILRKAGISPGGAAPGVMNVAGGNNIAQPSIRPEDIDLLKNVR